MIQNYHQLVEKIASASNLSSEDIERKIEAKRAKLSGLISKGGAAQIVAAELGISFDKQKVKINELLPGMKRASLVGKIIRLFPVREYEKNKRKGKIGSFIIADATSNTRVVLWDTNHIKLIEDKTIKEEDVVEISNASVRENEIHLSGFSDIKLSSEKIGEVKRERDFGEKKILDFKISDAIQTRAVIVQIFEPRFFEVCPECKRKVVESGEGHICETHNKIVPLKRVLLNLVLDDGSESIRAVLFSEQIEQLGIKSEELEGDAFLAKRNEFLGKEAFFSGTVRQNKLFNNPELFISEIKDVDIDKLIEVLEKTQ